MEVTAENKKDFEILTNALLGRIDQINEAIIAHNTKIATLNKVYNGAVVGSVLAETYNGVSKPDSEKSNNAIYTGVAKVR